jgi:hypothetical protein
MTVSPRATACRCVVCREWPPPLPARMLASAGRGLRAAAAAAAAAALLELCAAERDAGKALAVLRQARRGTRARAAIGRFRHWALQTIYGQRASSDAFYNQSGGGGRVAGAGRGDAGAVGRAAAAGAPHLQPGVGAGTSAEGAMGKAPARRRTAAPDTNQSPNPTGLLWFTAVKGY